MKIRFKFKKVPFCKKDLDDVFNLYEPLFLLIDKVAPPLSKDELKLLCIIPCNSDDDE